MSVELIDFAFCIAGLFMGWVGGNLYTISRYLFIIAKAVAPQEFPGIK